MTMRQFIYYHPDLYRRFLAVGFACALCGGMASSFNLSLPQVGVHGDVASAAVQPQAPQPAATLKSLPGKDGSAAPAPSQTQALPQSAATALTLDGDAQTLGRTLNGMVFGDSQWPALQALWIRESHWNPAAKNPWSGACGIPQALPCGKMGAVNANGTSALSASAQINWGLNYIKARYGTPSGAWHHEQVYGWY